MAMKWGKCTNYDQCDYARDNRVVETDTSNFKCPGCGRVLIPTQPPDSPPGKRFLTGASWLLLGALGALLGALIVVGIGNWLMRVNTPRPGQTGGGQTAATVAPTPAGAPPTITSPLQIQVTAGQPFRYQIIATHSPIQFAADNLPAFLVLNSASGTLTGTPPTAGSFRIPLHAVNAVGAGSAELVLTITPVMAGTTPPHILLRIHGSNTIGKELAPNLAKKFLEYKGYVDIQVTPLADRESLIQGRKPAASQYDAIEIKAHGSSTAFDATEQNKQVGLAASYCDIGMASRRIKPEEVAKLKNLGFGDLQSRSSEHVIALDGVAVIVHPSNPINSLMLEDLRRIFLREITDWDRVMSREDGNPVYGVPGTIALYVRDEQSGTFDIFKDLVLAGAKLDRTGAHFKEFEDSQELSASVSADKNGIGFIGLSYIGTAKALRISTGGARALAPNRFTVKSEDYPLSRRLYFYLPEKSTAIANEFLGFTLSNEGQKIVDEAGFVSLGPSSEKDKSIADAEKQRLLENPNVPGNYKDLIRNADRHNTPFNFRFDAGTFKLDNKSFRDVGRLANILAALELRRAEVILIGFADPHGSEADNLRLSKQRAAAVANELAAEGIGAAVVTGFGKEPSLLLDRGDSEESMQKNRRVEVWLRRP